MANSISGVASVQQAYQPQPAASPKPKAAEAAEQPKGDTVNISSQGKQAVQLRAGNSTPAEKLQEAKLVKE